VTPTRSPLRVRLTLTERTLVSEDRVDRAHDRCHGAAGTIVSVATARPVASCR
jgi:hypothetical protein